MKKITLFLVFAFFMQASFAAFVPLKETNKTESSSIQIENLVRKLSVEEFQIVTGKKFNRLQKWQYKRLQRKLNNGKSFYFPERDDLTEGFQALPFFGSLLTFGIVYLVMLFTAQDRNALRWAGFGFTVVALLLSAALLIGTMSGY